VKETIEAQEVQSRIYRIRGQQVMLDSDLAMLYGVLTKRLNEQVRRNMPRFPPDFMFRLSPQEAGFLRSQNATLKVKGRGAHRKYLPYVFTEHGVAMLSSVLKSARAIQVNIGIVRAFVKLRRLLMSDRDLKRRIEKVEGKLFMHDTDIRLLHEDMRGLKERSSPPPSFKVKGFE
jgi:hypothetical protein